MVWAYYDESGIYESGELQSLTMGCCVSPVERWAGFEARWSKMLADFEIPEFHMTDFEAWVGPFDFRLPNGERDKVKHNSLLNEALDVISDSVEGVHGFTSTSIIDNSKNLHSWYFEDCFVGSVKSAVREFWGFYQKPINMVFDKQNHFSKDGINFYAGFYDFGPERARIGSLTSESSDRVLSLQAADLVAYEMARCQRPNRPERYPFVYLKNAAKERGFKMTLAFGPMRSRTIRYGR